MKTEIKEKLQEQKEKIDKALAAIDELDDEGTLIKELYSLADWAEANMYEVPINLPSVLYCTAATLEFLLEIKE